MQYFTKLYLQSRCLAIKTDLLAEKLIPVMEFQHDQL